jgi:hypothetical protein
VLLPGKSTAITADPNGNFWITVPPLPSVFSGQAIYVNSNATIVPGVYDVDIIPMLNHESSIRDSGY